MAENERINIAFSAIDPVLRINVPDKKEKNTNTFVWYGNDNRYPLFLYDCYSNCPTLQTIVNGLADYVCGNGVSSTVLAKPNPKETWDEFITHLSADYFLYGVCYIQVVRNLKKEVSQLYWLDALYVRADKDCETFYYNEDFGKNYVKQGNTLTYPKFKKDIIEMSSIIQIRTPLGKGTYGSPIWGSSLKSVLTEIGIDDFHMNELENNFAVSSIINFNNGVPSDEDKDEIEKLVRRKFTGHQNAGTFMLSFNNGVANRTTVERLSTDDFDERYMSLANKTQKQIFTAFGVSPVIFGVEKDTTGFNSEDYQQAFLLANRTKIYPVQKRIIDTIDKVLGVTGSIRIEPFTIDFEDTNNADNQETVN